MKTTIKNIQLALIAATLTLAGIAEDPEYQVGKLELESGKNLAALVWYDNREQPNYEWHYSHWRNTPTFMPLLWKKNANRNESEINWKREIHAKNDSELEKANPTTGGKLMAVDWHFFSTSLKEN